MLHPNLLLQHPYLAHRDRLRLQGPPAPTHEILAT
jgi:hypothetical protein